MKKKRNITTFVIIAVIIFSACNKNHKYFYTDSETFSSQNLKIIKIEGSILQFNDTIWNPVEINIRDSLLFLKNRSTEYVYDIYNLNNNEKINECIKIGQGPNDFIFPKIVQSMDTNIWIFDATTAVLKNFSISDLINNQIPVSKKNIPLKNSASDKTAILSNGNILASINRLPRGGFDIYDSNGIFLDSIGKFPDFTHGDLSDSEKVLSLRYGFATNLVNRLFISYTFTDLIEVYDFNGNLIKRMHGPDQIELVMERQSAGGGLIAAKPIKGKTYKCYSYPVYAGNEVFVLYFGELSENYQDRNYKIIVFDWDGNPLRMYELDTHLFTFTVDYENRIIYGITNSPEYRIIKFKY